MGNGNSSRPAESPAAAHNFQLPNFQDVRCILRRVYRIGRTNDERPESRYNLLMLHFAIIAMKVLEVMFFVGLAGSSVVVLISFAEDGKELFGKDEPPESRADRPASTPAGTSH